MLQTSVEMVNPGGTGSPAFVISARPAPLPPSKSFMLRLPSAFPLPKKYTYFFDLPAVPAPPAFPAAPALPAFFDIVAPVQSGQLSNLVIESLIAGLSCALTLYMCSAGL